jgi:hypothetical protein
VTIQHRLKQLERKAGLNKPRQITLNNPSKKEIERVRREYPGATLLIVNIELPPEEASAVS